MCGLPVFPPKPKLENMERPRRTFRRIAGWVRGAKRSNRIAQEAHADRPVVRGEPLFDGFRLHDRVLKKGGSHSGHD
jgi:hypothetical protein